MTVSSLAAEIKEPWVVTTQRGIAPSDIPEHIRLLVLDGAEMTEVKGLYQQFISAFQLPDYFGKNFNALDECLSDLEWLPADGYLLVIRNADRLLESESDGALDGLLSLLVRTGEKWATPVRLGEYWDRDAVPFHTVLEVDANKAPRFCARLEKLGLEFPTI